jgi:hypothetical protein
MIGVAKIGTRASRGGGGAIPVNPDFISTWDTFRSGSASDTVVLPLLSGGTYSGTIDWGDSTTSTLSYANRTHVYASSGTYTITISGSDIQGWQFANTGDRRKITDISNWGTLKVTTDQAFYGCTNLDVTAIDAPTLTSNALSLMFHQCVSLTTCDFSSWNTSVCTNIDRTFANCDNFNGDVSTWDVSNATFVGNIYGATFTSCFAFNSDIGGWDISNITSVRVMMYNCDAFDRSLANWDVANITAANSFMSLASGLSTANYDATLVGWEATLEAAYPSGAGSPNVNINFGGSQYSNALMNVGEARYNLINVFGWTITDGGAV